MNSKNIGIVTEIVDSTNNLDDVRVLLNGKIQRAYNYISLTNGISVGDEVVLNKTAVKTKSSSQGYHFILSNLTLLKS